MKYRQPFTEDYPITQRFGEKITDPKGHTGIDYACPTGTPVLASAAGSVFYTGWRNGGYGYCVFIKHPDGMVSIYEHLLQDIPVQVGQQVAQGQVIGWSGSTGNSTGPHLHFEIRDQNGKAVDPMRYLHSVDDSLTHEPDTAEPEKQTVREGKCRIVCDSAWVRDWNNVERSYLVYRDTEVYVFADVKYRDGLPFRYIGAERCIAEHDAYGTQILLNQEDK